MPMLMGQDPANIRMDTVPGQYLIETPDRLHFPPSA